MSSSVDHHKSTTLIINVATHKKHLVGVDSQTQNNRDHHSMKTYHHHHYHLTEDQKITMSNANLGNWRTRTRQPTQTQATPPPVIHNLQNTPDITIGLEALEAGLPDSATIPINSTYLTQFIDHWSPFTSWTLIRPHPFSSDIVQGLLGNCWFLSALALVAERTDLLVKILPTSAEDFARTRTATVRLFRQGKWHSVAVDDVLPVSRSGQLVFSQAKRNQLFVPLIEKALAKLYGGYDGLRGGLTSEGMTLLTGFPCEIQWCPPNRRALHHQPGPGTSLEQQMDELWIRMISYNSAGFLMGASCGRSLNPELGSKVEYKARGLLKEHAYSVLDVVSMGRLRLVKLRNPWGTLVWNGAWSDRSPHWTSSLRRDLVPEGAEEGIFWISFEDFCRYFEMTIVCKIRGGWYSYGFEGHLPGSVLDSSGWTVFELKIDDRLIEEECTVAEVSATLYQEMGERITPNLAIFLVIFELLNSNSSPVIGSLTGSSICNIQGAVTCEAELRRGKRYLMGVFGFNDWYSTSTRKVPETPKSTYVLRLHSSKPILIDTFSPNSILLGDMITYYVKAAGKPIYRPNVITYQLNNDWAGLISVVENLDPELWLQVSMRTSLKPTSTATITQESSSSRNPQEAVSYSHNLIRSEDITQHDQMQSFMTNFGADKSGAELGCDGDGDDSRDLAFLASTRNTLVTRDLVPPGHCQLINVITNQRPIISQHISIKLNFRFQSFESWFKQKLAKGSKSWETSPSTELFHRPSIHDQTGFIYGFHCPRAIGLD